MPRPLINPQLFVFHSELLLHNCLFHSELLLHNCLFCSELLVQIQALLDIVGQAGGDAMDRNDPQSLIPVIVKWYSSSQRELLSLGLIQTSRDTRLSAIARHVLAALPSRLSQV